MKPSRTELVREASNNLRVGLLTGLLGGTLLGLLFGTATLALNPQLLESVTDVLILVLGLQAVYAVFCIALGLIGALGKTAIFSLTGRSLSDTKTAAFVTGAVFFLITGTYGYLWCRWHRIGGLVPEHAPTMANLGTLLAIAAVAVLLARLLTYAFYLLIVHFKKPERRQPGDMRKAFFVLVYMAGAFAIFLAVLQLTRPGMMRFSGLNREDVVASDTPVLFLGIDGLARGDLERLLREQSNRSRGQLDHEWADGLSAGVRAPVEIAEATIPPATWTLLATGRSLEAHGIVDYQAQMVRGLSRPFTVNPSQVGLFQLFQDVLPFFRLTRPVPMRSYMRESKGLWNMATDAGLESAIVNWWVSWPAEKIQGRMVSNQTYLRLKMAGVTERAPASPSVVRLTPEGETYPGSLLQELAPLANPGYSDARADSASIGNVTADQTNASLQRAGAILSEFGIPIEVIESDLFYARATAHLLRTGRPRLCMLYLPGPDVLRRLIDRNVTDPEERRTAWLRALDAYWTVLDPALDHAFDAAPGRRRILLALPRAPFPGEAAESGLLAAAGPGIATGELSEPFPLVDLAPTVLWLLGLPHSEEMDGAPRTDLLQPAAAESLGEPRVIASYGRMEKDDRPTPSGELDEPMLELLRSLGYLDS